MRSVLITGGIGFIGTELASKFRKSNWEVVTLDSRGKPSDNHIVVDLMSHTEAKAVTQKWREFDAVVHLAGASRIRGDMSEEEYHRRNVKLTQYVRRLWRSAKLILASSTSVYDEFGNISPNTPYAQSKLDAEKYADIVLRFASVAGQNERGEYFSVIDRMIQSAIKDKIIRVWRPSTWRPIIALRTLCAEILIAANQKDSGEYAIYDTCDTIGNYAFAVKDGIRHYTGKYVDVKVLEESELTVADETNPIPISSNPCTNKFLVPSRTFVNWVLKDYYEGILRKYNAEYPAQEQSA